MSSNFIQTRELHAGGLTEEVSPSEKHLSQCRSPPDLHPPHSQADHPVESKQLNNAQPFHTWCWKNTFSLSSEEN